MDIHETGPATYMHQASAWRELGIFLGKVAIITLALAFLGTQGYRIAMSPLYSNADQCNVEVVPILGMIGGYDSVDPTAPDDGTLSVTTPRFVASELERIAHDDAIVGVIAYIDVPGGTPAASERMMYALASSKKPLVVQAGDMLTSGGYLAALGAQKIIASPFTDVGSIGISYSYLDASKHNEKDGMTWNSLTSAPYKDYGSPDKPLTTEERALIERDAKMYHDTFISHVAKRRGLSEDVVRALADGSSVPASLAFEKGLIDGVGDETEALNALGKEIGIDASELIVCR